MAVCYCETNIVSSNMYIDPLETWKYAIWSFHSKLLDITRRTYNTVR